MTAPVPLDRNGDPMAMMHAENTNGYAVMRDIPSPDDEFNTEHGNGSLETQGYSEYIDLSRE